MSKLKSMFKVPDLRNKISFTLVLGYLNLLSGAALTRFAVLEPGIMPYITTKIIIQLLVLVVPS